MTKYEHSLSRVNSTTRSVDPDWNKPSMPDNYGIRNVRHSRPPSCPFLRMAFCELRNMSITGTYSSTERALRKSRQIREKAPPNVPSLFVDGQVVS